jgi:MerR family redox-sensitive transcriptional activator SoxR
MADSASNSDDTNLELTVGELARLAGTSVSALRFYEDKGLIAGQRSPSNQRRYRPGMLKRVMIIRMAQSVGIPLAEVKDALAALPEDGDVTDRDWQVVAERWRPSLQARIDELVDLRDNLGDRMEAWLRDDKQQPRRRASRRSHQSSGSPR